MHATAKTHGLCVCHARPTPSHDSSELGGVHRGVLAGVWQDQRHDRCWRWRLAARLAGWRPQQLAPDRRRQARCNRHAQLRCPGSPPDAGVLIRIMMQLDVAMIWLQLELIRKLGLTDRNRISPRTRQSGAGREANLSLRACTAARSSSSRCTIRRSSLATVPARRDLKWGAARRASFLAATSKACQCCICCCYSMQHRNSSSRTRGPVQTLRTRLRCNVMVSNANCCATFNMRFSTYQTSRPGMTNAEPVTAAEQCVRFRTI